MALKLRSLLKGPKLRSGVKSLVLAVSFSFLPLWAIGVLAFVFYAMPSTFMFEFLGSLIALGMAVAVAEGAIPAVFLAAIAGIFFFVLLGIKGVFLPHRGILHTAFSASIFLTMAYGFFVGTVALPVLSISVFLLLRDRFASFTVLSQRAAAAAAVISLVLSEIAWGVGWLGASHILSTVVVSLFGLSMLTVVHDHLSGDISAKNSIFRGSAIAVLGIAGLIMAAF
ncbi:MAG: hypothetical protein PHG66_01615 [Candidatus Colwellbacteria bacterium]|nr:hypothetical protein [Candidatus Colwellbacteria bacterium]